MNKMRRKALQNIIAQLEGLKIDLEDLQQEEQEYLDNMPENMWGGERYERAEEVCSYIEDAIANIEEAVSNIDYAAE